MAPEIQNASIILLEDTAQTITLLANEETQFLGQTLTISLRGTESTLSISQTLEFYIKYGGENTAPVWNAGFTS